ncbi:MAG TPA: DNA polymerase III subunit [bacterium]|nr:DNA polymerase III subunit [bacterium]
MEIQGHQLQWSHIGNERVVRSWAAHLISEQISHCYLLVGPADIGKASVAKNFARTLVCQHRQEPGTNWPCGQCSACQQTARGVYPDFYEVDLLPDKKKIGIEQVRELLEKVSLSSFADNYQVVIIRHAETLSDSAANALLKNLEEPKAKVVFILLVENIAAIPGTIVSRSQVFRFYPVDTGLIYDYLVDERGTNRELAKDLAQVALGRPNLAIRFLEQPNLYLAYCQSAQLLLKLIRARNLAERLAYLSELYPKTAASAGEAEWSLWQVWLGLARDLLLIKQDQTPLIQHWFMRQELTAAAAAMAWTDLLNLFTKLGAAREYLVANVQPNLVFHNLTANN